MYDLKTVSVILLFILTIVTFILNIFYIYIPIGNTSRFIQKVSNDTSRLALDIDNLLPSLRVLVNSTQTIENAIIPNIPLFKNALEISIQTASEIPDWEQFINTD
jgi:hypothetical protein